ncbi:4-hydroxyproline epimerase [Kushneria aurantia]|uniref:4-hydroxyproline epimerase n=1 Tax=Kushneria aurantia TaxID=504092 RepID=A0ABV6G4N0_9GAMM|nr:4-hydroxyproline epimerase [Kushneria aurantia]
MRMMRVIDSHTGGEPTRLVMEGFPELTGRTIVEMRDELCEQHDHWRRACLLEPRGHDVLVGALYCEPESEGAICGVIFFNNSGYLGMCGHGVIGLVTSLYHLGYIVPGVHKIDTPVGLVEARLHEDSAVTVRNVPAWRYRKDVGIAVPGNGYLHGDIAWGGNWFFLVSDHGQRLTLDNVDVLTDFTCAIRQELEANGITGESGALIDHVELFGDDEETDSRNFVLCPGKAYDRSPCGIGTSAKIACLAADGRLDAGEFWTQSSTTGSRFEAYYQNKGDCIVPWIKGRAWLSAENTLLFDEDDPFIWGIST